MYVGETSVYELKNEDKIAIMKEWKRCETFIIICKIFTNISHTIQSILNFTKIIKF